MQWEYRTLKVNCKGFFGGKFDEGRLDEMLNDLGRDGWELVSSFDTNELYGSTRYMVFTFKRARNA